MSASYRLDAMLKKNTWLFRVTYLLMAFNILAGIGFGYFNRNSPMSWLLPSLFVVALIINVMNLRSLRATRAAIKSAEVTVSELTQEVPK